MTRIWILILGFWASAAAAQEFVAVDGALSDRDFYRLIACAARPDAGCSKRLVYWPEAQRFPLRVGYASKPEGLEPWRRQLYVDALQSAVEQVNNLGAGIRLAVTDGSDQDVDIHIIDTPAGGIMQNIGVPAFEGKRLGLGQVLIRTRGDAINDAVIVISQDTRRRAVASVVLEELVQSLGLMTDIRSPAYRRSVFSEDSNSGTRLQGQDAMVIRRHYPPNQ